MSSSALQEALHRVKEGADIVQIVGQYLPLKRVGSRWLALCPFHNDRRPSLNVNPAIGIYKCFACGAGGDAIKFVQEYEKVGFAEAIRTVAAKAGITLPENLNFGEKGANDKFAASSEANQIALQVYVESLDKSTVALEYLKTRNLDRETVKHFQIGFAPESPDAILKRAQTKGISTASFIEAGILGDSNGRIYDRFAGRLIFPIFNLSGRVIAFGGRILPGKEGAKYVNSPESPLYHKGRILYGFNFARGPIDQSGEAVLVEGYMDLISLWQAGMKNVVAVCGTALTADHAVLLARFAQKALLFFDGDAPGRNAVRRSLEPLISHGVEIRVPALPAGEDPDSFVKSHTGEEMKNLFESADDLSAFLIRSTGKSVAALSPEEKEALLKESGEMLKQAPSEIVRDGHAQKMRASLGLPPAPAKTVRVPTRGTPTVLAGTGGGTGLFVAGANTEVRSEAVPEWNLLQILLSYPESARVACESADLSWFSDERARHLFDHALAQIAESGGLDLRTLADRVSESLRDALTMVEIRSGDESGLVARWLEDYLGALELRFLQRELASSTTLMDRMEWQKRLQRFQTKNRGSMA